MSLILQWLQRKVTVTHFLLGTQFMKLMNLQFGFVLNSYVKINAHLSLYQSTKQFYRSHRITNGLGMEVASGAHPIQYL